MLLLFGHRLYPGFLNRKILAGYWIVHSSCLLYVLIMPLTLWCDLISFIEYLNISAMIPFYYLMFCAIRRQRSGSIILTIGFTLFIIAATNDALYDLRIIYTEHLISFGIVSIALSFSFYLSRRYSQSFKKIDDLTGTLKNKNALRLLSEIDQSLDIVHTLITPRETTDVMLVMNGIELLGLMLAYWGKCNPGKGKIELARESGLWQTYVNKDGWERTQTLDKYLRADTFPQKPRWNRVFSTVDYVLASTYDKSSDRKILEEKLEILRGMV